MKYLILIPVFALGAGCGFFSAHHASRASQPPVQGAYAHVMATRSIRCGYALWPGYVDRDPNTGKLSGIWVEYMQALGDLTGFKIDWSSEVAIADIGPSLQNGKFDVFCGGLWRDLRQSVTMDYASPITYQAVVAVVRMDDHRFDKDVHAANDARFRIATIDGGVDDVIRAKYFPHAQTSGLPKNADVSDMLMNVATRKADMTFTSPETVARFVASNPGTLRILHPDSPLQVFAETLAVAAPEQNLRRLLSNATEELLDSGAIEAILQRHELYKNSFYRVALSYSPGL